MPRFLAPLLAVGLLALTFASPAAAAPQQDALLFTQSSARATLTPTACRCDGRYILTLRRVAKHTVWFSDRPNRHAGHIGTRNFARGWSSYGFAADPPDAALSAIDASGRRHTDVFELTRPRYSAKRRTLRYLARTVPYTTGRLSARRGRDAGRFHDVSLSINDAVAPVVDGCLLAFAANCTDPDLSGAELPGVDLRHAALPAARMINVNLSGADLRHAELSGADLSKARLVDADVRDARLVDANLTAALLVRADLTRADLSGARLTGASLEGAVMTGAELTDAIYCRTTMPDGSINNSGC